jgi:hypothetical protein
LLLCPLKPGNLLLKFAAIFLPSVLCLLMLADLLLQFLIRFR